MRPLSLLALSTVSTLALAIATPALAQDQGEAQAPPPGAPESSTQDDDPTASPQQDQDVSATAAESAAPLDTGEGDNAIVVTGSRIARPEFSFPNPIQAYTSETIQQAGATNLTDFLIDSPALRGSTDNIDVAGSNLTSAQFVGVNLLDLRYLGEERTLVLLNGRRHIAGSPGQAAVDINTIPVDLIDRIDILTGGTSAIYGADGVSGVVNFVLKRDFEGLSVRAQAGISQRGDSGNRFISAVWGNNFADDRGNVALAYEFNELDRFSQRQRLNYGDAGPSVRFNRNPDDLPDDPNIPDQIPMRDLRWLDSSPGGAIDVDFDGQYIPDFTGEGTPYDRGVVVPGFSVGGSSTPQDSYFGDQTPASRRHMFNAFGSFEVSPALRFFGEGKYVRAKAHTFGQPSFDFFTLLFPDNAYLNNLLGDLAPNGAFVTGRDNFDFGIRRASTERRTIRTVLGADGRITDNLRYELSYTFGQTKSSTNNQNDRLTDRYFAALDAVVNPATGQITCRINLPGETQIQGFAVSPTLVGPDPITFQPGQCVPLNILGNGSPSQAALDWIQVDHGDFAKIRHHVVNGYVSGDTGGFFNLPGGPVGFALGAEYRKESSSTIPDQVTQDGLLADYSTTNSEIGDFNVKEVFGEVNFPILSKVTGADTLSVGGAVRFSDYSTVGSTKTWSTNGVYAPVRDLLFRGTYSQAVRAPNVNELFAGAAGGFFFIVDPCGPDQLTGGTSTRQANCIQALGEFGIDPTDPEQFDPALNPTSPQNSSIQGLIGGNRDLQEETAKTWTAGLVLRPRFIPGLNLAFDWYDIKIKDAINTPTANELVNLCYDQPTLDNVYCDAVSRSPTTGFVNGFLLGPENVASFDTEGLDIALNYRFRPFNDGSSFNLKINGNYLHKLTFIPTPGAEVDDDRNENNRPKWSATGDLTWTKGPLTINYGINWFTKTRRFPIERTNAQPDLLEKRYIWFPEYWEHQAQVAFDVERRMNIYFGVNNLMDTKPATGSAAYPHNAIGRFFYAGVRLKPF